ncbi:MAG: pirin family protein [Xanthomonadales bacterium]|nr:pirin family protein [Gammaproteobacteria bacterium]NNE06216.1 pirin family protein [Xanthomonadales bacterium]NNL96445.1 pirin family protein [Xanthomonadales bacterium]
MSELMMIKPSITDLGAFEVRRLLPSRHRRSVGPFVFWDHFGPVTLPAGSNMDVRPHPHIGLATLTWLFDGQITHRDSLGYQQDIKPGAVNWMTAGKGIVHSERTPQARRGQDNPLHGLQIWLGLPGDFEETEPSFQHYPASDIPEVECGGVRFKLIAGSALGSESPVEVYSPLCYLAGRLDAGQSFRWPRVYPEQAVYVVEGSLRAGGQAAEAGQMVVLPDHEAFEISSLNGARIAILAGEPLGKRYVWWNFVSSSRKKIRAAAALWDRGGFDRVDGDDEFIPLPENRPMP